MALRMQPLADRVVVKPHDTEERSRGGIYLPDTAAKEKPQEGTVVAVGPGKLHDDGQRRPIGVKVGDTVLFAKYAGSEVKLDDVDYLILAEKDILAVINDQGAGQTG